ncbi:MAG TPA: cyclic pyranopterin monophosphate synthase MoaC [Planctomycetota bacterium]|nr:cyclic pyranopterin monophosphate synthase MoaC [Planctomycetota bacterium]
MGALSHTDDEGRARMVDVGLKPDQRRRARAAGMIALSADAIALVRQNQIKKGDVLTVAQIAGIQAAKRTAELIPLCHPLLLNRIDVRLSVADDRITAESEVRCIGQTGAEMEALTAVSVALLTVYDMCKAVDKHMKIGEIVLVEKEKQDAI